MFKLFPVYVSFFPRSGEIPSSPLCLASVYATGLISVRYLCSNGTKCWVVFVEVFQFSYFFSISIEADNVQIVEFFLIIGLHTSSRISSSLSDRAVRVQLVKQADQVVLDFGGSSRYFVADTPHNDRGMVAVSFYEISHIFLPPFIKVISIVIGGFRLIPSVQSFVQYHDSHRIA